jgi:hypothetical protein
MLFTTVLSTTLLSLAGSAFAQSTPAGFTPSVNKTLDVYYGTTYITPGLMVRKSSKPSIIIAKHVNAHTIPTDPLQQQSPQKRPPSASQTRL